MEKMMREAKIAEAKRERLKKAERRKADKKFGGGMKGGFFNRKKTAAKGKKKKKKKTMKPEKEKADGIGAGKAAMAGSGGAEDDITDLPSVSASKASAPGFMPEVQAAMAADMPNFLQQSKSQWANEALMQRIKDNPELLKAMADPRFGPLMQQMQTDPNRVMEMAKSSPELAQFLKLFGSVVGGHFQALGEKQAEEDAKREADRKREQEKQAAAAAAHAAKVEAARSDPHVQRVLGNAQLKALLQDPKVKSALQECQTEPGALQRHMRDPKMRAAFMMMQQAGLVQFQ